MIDKYVPQSQETFAELCINKDIFSSLEHFAELGLIVKEIFIYWQKIFLICCTNLIQVKLQILIYLM